MARIAVISMDLRVRGGVHSKLRAFLEYARSRAHVCDLYYPEEGSRADVAIDEVRRTGSVVEITPVPVRPGTPHFLRADAFARRCAIPSRYAADLIRREIGLPSERVQDLPVPLDLGRFCPRSAPPAGRPYLISVGRLFRGKGFQTILLAFREIAGRFREVDLQIVGDGPDRTDLDRLTQRLGLRDRVVFRGMLRADELIEAYRNATHFVLASTRETLAIVILEAMACGLPVVSTASGGPADHVIPGRTGLLVPVGVWHALAQASSVILEDGDLSSRLGREGREHAERTFGTEIVYGRLDAIYRDHFSLRPAIPGVC